jgi:hypothetical protein
LYWTVDSRSLGSPRLTPDPPVLADFIRDQQEGPWGDELELRELSLVFFHSFSFLNYAYRIRLSLIQRCNIQKLTDLPYFDGSMSSKGAAIFAILNLDHSAEVIPMNSLPKLPQVALSSLSHSLEARDSLQP